MLYGCWRLPKIFSFGLTILLTAAKRSAQITNDAILFFIIFLLVYAPSRRRHTLSSCGHCLPTTAGETSQALIDLQLIALDKTPSFISTVLNYVTYIGRKPYPAAVRYSFFLLLAICEYQRNCRKGHWSSNRLAFGFLYSSNTKLR